MIVTEVLTKKAATLLLLTEGCVCCGIGVPEGRMICRACEVGARLDRRAAKRPRRKK